MRVAVVGVGAVGRTIARRLAGAGCEVRAAVRNPASTAAQALAEEMPSLTLAPVAAAIETSEIVVVAIPGGALEAFVAENARAVGSRVVVDATNDLRGETLHGLRHWRRHAPDAQVFRAFCSTGWEAVADPSFDGIQADLFYCGPDGEARTLAEELISAAGLRPVRVGDDDAADLLDSLARLWFKLAFDQGRGRDIGFKLLERPTRPD